MTHRETGKQTDGGKLTGRQRGGEGERGWQIDGQVGKQTDGGKLTDRRRGGEGMAKRQASIQTAAN